MGIKSYVESEYVDLELGVRVKPGSVVEMEKEDFVRRSKAGCVREATSEEIEASETAAAEGEGGVTTEPPKAQTPAEKKAAAKAAAKAAKKQPAA